MRLKLAALIFGFCLIATIPAKAETIELTFSPDSLIRTDGKFNFGYPSARTITINPELSLPVKMVYISSPVNFSEFLDIEILIENSDQVFIEKVPEEKLQFSNLITALGDREKSSPLHDLENIEHVLYDKQIISKNGNSMVALSILPVTIDQNNNLIFNTKITINTGSAQNETFTGETVSAALDNNATSRTNLVSDKVGASNDEESIPRYVIITSPDLAPSFQALVNFKNDLGINTIIKLTDSIYAEYSGMDNIEQIRNYLKDFYNNGGEYVLLGGNDAIVPVRYLYYYNTSTPPSNPYNLMPSDLYYADLDGDWDLDGDGIWGEPTHDSPDIVPELKVGRLPVMTTVAIDNYISKLILYQTNPGFGDFDYLAKSLFFSSDQMRDYPSMGQHGFIADEFPEEISIDTSQTIEMPDGYDPSPTNPNGAFGIEKISEGFGLIHILAHGRKDGFRVKASGYDSYPASLILSTPQSGGHGSLLNLAPNGKVSLYYSLSCQVGAYDLDSANGMPSDWSFAETVIAAKNAGAIGLVGYSRWGWVYSSYYLEASFTNHLYGDAEGSPVKAMYYSWLDYPYYRDLIYGQNFFGDPTLEFHRTKPLKLDLDLSMTKSKSTLFVSNNNSPIPDANVVISKDGQILENGLTDENGYYESATDLRFGVDYCLTAFKDGYTVFRTVYTPTLVLDSDEDNEPVIPENYGLEQNFPNPFNPVTTIEYSLPKADIVILEFFNILGQLVDRYSIGHSSAGRYSFTWDGTDINNQPLSSGIYFYRLRSGEYIETRKMTLIK